MNSCTITRNILILLIADSCTWQEMYLWYLIADSCTSHLYKKYPGMSPWQLTDMRAASVNNDCYTWSAIKHGLHKHVLHASQELHKHIAISLDSFDNLSSSSTFGFESETSLPKVSC